MEFLAANGPGAHHLGFLIDDVDAVVDLGATRISEAHGREFGISRFCYLDTWSELGLFVELVEDPDAMMMSIMPWK